MSKRAVSAVSSPSLLHSSRTHAHTNSHTGVNMTYKPTYFQPQLKLHSQHCAGCNPVSMLWLCSNPLPAPQTSMLPVTLSPRLYYHQLRLPWLLLPWQSRSRPATGDLVTTWSKDPYVTGALLLCALVLSRNCFYCYVFKCPDIFCPIIKQGPRKNNSSLESHTYIIAGLMRYRRNSESPTHMFNVV